MYLYSVVFSVFNDCFYKVEDDKLKKNFCGIKNFFHTEYADYFIQGSDFYMIAEGEDKFHKEFAGVNLRKDHFLRIRGTKSIIYIANVIFCFKLFKYSS